MARPFGPQPHLISRKYRHSFAWQHLNTMGVTLYKGATALNLPVPTLYPITLFRSHYDAGDQFLPPGEIRTITSYQALMDLGFVIISNDIREGRGQTWDTGQRVRYELRRVNETGENYGKLPKDHYVEHDTTNARVRLMGHRAGPLNFGPWLDLQRTVPDAIAKGGEVPLYNYGKRAEMLMERMARQWSGAAAKPKRVVIDEVPFMISDANEIICIPITGDMPSILITGLKRTGKCELFSSNKDFVLDATGRWLRPPETITSVLTLNDELKLEPATVTAQLSRTTREVWRLTTRSGRTVCLTPEHPLRTLTRWVPLKDLKIGDFIATPREYRLSSPTAQDLRLVKVMAYLIADGSTAQGIVDMVSGEPHIIDEYLESLSVFGNTATDCRIRRFPRHTRVLLRGSLKAAVQAWMERAGLWRKRAGEKFIPDVFLTLPNAQLAVFLNRLYSCDGGVEEDAVVYTSKSELLARQVQHLLLRFGIPSSIRRIMKRATNSLQEKSPYWSVSFSGRDAVERFADHIGIFRPSKTVKLATLGAKKQAGKHFNSSVDVIPHELWSVARPSVPWTVIGRHFGHKRPKGAIGLTTTNVCRQNIIKLAEIDPTPFYKTLAESDVFWDRVDAIEPLPPDEVVVWDLEVDHPAHNYVTNDIIVHNCVIQEGRQDFVLDGEGRPCKIADRPKTALVLDDQHRLVSAPVTDITSRPVTEVITMETERGRHVTLTPEHPVLTPEGWRPVGELPLGTFVATPARYAKSEADETPLPATDVDALAYWLAAGVWSTLTDRYNNVEDPWLNPPTYISIHDKTFRRHDFAALLTTAGIPNRFIGGRYRSVYCRRAAVQALLQTYGVDPTHPHIPVAIMRAGTRTIRQFLSAWFTVRGIVDPKGNIRWMAHTEVQARQLHHLGLRVGLPTMVLAQTRRDRPEPLGWIVYLGDQDALDTCLTWLQCRSPRLLQQLAALTRRRKTQLRGRRIRYGDELPREVLLREASDPARLATIMHRINTLGQSLRRDTVRRLAETMPDAGLQRVLARDVYWARITALTKKTGTFTAWDMVIDHPAHNFIANDVVVHNSFCLHSLVSRFFWKPGLGYKICILNDSSRETGTWCLPNNNLDQLNMLARLGERPLPLPCVYFHPAVKADQNKLHMGEVGFDVLIPFKTIIEDHKLYLELKDSTRYFTKVVPDLLRCRSAEEVDAVFDNMTLTHNTPSNTVTKIRAEFETLLDSKMTDVSTTGQEPWHTSTAPGTPYNPFTAALVSGVIPVLETQFLSTHPDKKLLPLYFSFFAGDLFMRQIQDADFQAEQSEILLVVDEAHNISHRGASLGGDLLLRRCVREGGPRRIGTLLATQKFEELPDVIKDNTTYLICFKNPGEATAIANQYNLGKHIAKQITDLAKHQCIAYTTEHFIIYDSHGRRRQSTLNEVFVGHTLPPYSQHKRPKADDEGGT